VGVGGTVPIERIGNDRKVTMQMTLETEGSRTEGSELLKVDSMLDFAADSGAKTMEIAVAVPDGAAECVSAKVTVSLKDAKRTLTAYPRDCDD
jgi:YbbR domain-containing protein